MTAAAPFPRGRKPFSARGQGILALSWAMGIILMACGAPEPAPTAVRPMFSVLPTAPLAPVFEADPPPSPTVPPTPTPTPPPTPAVVLPPVPPTPPTPPPPVQHTSPATDRAALVALFNATDGPNWTRNLGWLTDPPDLPPELPPELLPELPKPFLPMFDWYGVSIDAEGRVIALSLEGNGLRGQLPPELGNLDRLRFLYLVDNDLTGGMPAELGNLTNMEGMSLRRNRLTGEIPPELGNLTMLEHLHLGWNRLTGEIPPELGNLTRLVVLDLYRNDLTGEIPAELGNLTVVKTVYIGDNDLSHEMPRHLADMAHLLIMDRPDPPSFSGLSNPPSLPGSPGIGCALFFGC